MKALANKGSNLQTQSKKKQFIVFGLCSFLALCICLATLVVTVKKLEKDNTNVQTGDIYGYKVLLDNSRDSICEYIYTATNKTQNNKFIKVNTYTDIYVDDDKISVNGEAHSADVKLIAFAKNKLLPVVDTYYGEDYTGVFGTVYNKMPLINLGACEGISCNVTVGQADEAGAPIYDDSGNLVDAEYYFFEISAEDVSALDEAFLGSFGAEDLPDVKGNFINDVSDYCTVSDMEIKASSYTIRAKVNIFTDELSYIELERIYDVKSDVAFSEEMAVFGEKKVDFSYKVINKFEYSYAGVILSADELYLEKGEESVINVNAVIENDSEYKVTFSSSDESKVTVDEMGYIYAKENVTEPVYVTVKLEYLGEVFTDSCAVYVESPKD